MTRAALTAAALAVACLAAPLRADEPKAENFALLVGVNEYDHAEMNKPKPLEYAEADVTELADLLERFGYKDNVMVLTGKKATKEAIIDQVAKLRKRGNGRGTVLVAFAGHGVQFEKDDEAYFCPYSTDLRKAVRNGEPVLDRSGRPVLEPVPDSCVKLTDVIAEFHGAKAGNRILLADCCRNDPTTGRGRAVGAGIKTHALPDNTALLLSCSHGEVAYEDKAWKHGVFFHQVLEGLKDGKGDADALYAHLKTAVPNALDALNLAGHPKQKPYRLFNGDISFGLVGGKHVSGKVDPKVDTAAQAEAAFREGYALKFGIKTQIDEWKALAAFEKARKLGHPVAAIHVARYYRYGGLVDKDEKHAANLEADALDALKALAAKKNPEAMLSLGGLYEWGFTLDKDGAKARDLYTRGEAVSQSPQLQFALGYVNLEGIGGAKDYKEAVRWLKKGVAQGDAKCQSLLGYMYNHGLGVDTNDAEAIALYKLAADQNLAKARLNLGIHYSQGNGVPKDERKALEQYEAAAQQYDPDALCNLGHFYETGTVVKKDLNKAYWCYDRAATQGHGTSLYNLGVFYLYGTWVAQDEDRALSFLRRAADKDNPNAKDLLKRLGRTP